MKLLLLNWRDIRNPRAGGAETLTYEVARRLVQRGHDVTWFTSRPEGLEAEEWVDGIRIVRRGSELTTRLYAPRLGRKDDYDLVVEEVNTLPYFALAWSRAPTLLYINQLAREVWWYEAAKPVAALGYLSEPLYLQAYRRVPTVTISESTLRDLQRLGLRGRIDVIPMAVNVEPVEELRPKRLEGHLIAVGRLAPSKRYEHAIEALTILRRAYNAATLTIVGDGSERGALERHASASGVADVVRFAGVVDEQEKVRLLTEADVLVGCSAREGWGLTVTEAALRGTVSVVYDIPGFRDSVVHQRTGILTESTPSALAAGIASVLGEADSYERLRTAALATARELSWEKTADAFEVAAEAARSS
jgi:glycosyltransferase involved in cell wall biosynthesis